MGVLEQVGVQYGSALGGTGFERLNAGPVHSLFPAVGDSLFTFSNREVLDSPQAASS
jgi:hypothetical protein